MHKVSIIGLERDRADILDGLMDTGVLDITDISERASSEEWSHFVRIDNKDEKVTELENEIERVSSSLNYLSHYDKRKKPLFESKKIIKYETYESTIIQRDVLKNIVERINAADGELALLKSEKNKLSNLIAFLKPWEPLKLPIDYTETPNTYIIMGVISVSVDINQMLNEVYEKISECSIQIINEDKDQIYLQIISHKSRQEEMLGFLNQKGFERISFDFKGTIKENINLNQSKIDEIHEKKQLLLKEIAKNANERDSLEIFYDYLIIQRDKKKAIKRLLNTDKTFIIEGWISDYAIDKFKENVNSKWKWDWAVTIEEAQKEEEFPILLKNNRFVQSFEIVTELYSLPNPKEADPNSCMAPFFFLFFGLMLGDAGYGILMSLVTGILLLKYKIEGAANKLLKLLFFSGISTFIWGAMFGGWFGDVAEQISSGRFKISPIWFDPLEDPMKLLTWSFIFGGAHLYVGMGLKAYNLIKEGKILDAVFDIGFWYILLTGLALLLVGGNFGIAGKYMSIIGAILLVITQGRHEKNVVKKLGKGILSLYDSVGFMSDVLSYSRLLALGLATGVIASVINNIGVLFGFNLLGIIIFIGVFFVGHIFNLLINALGAFVHSSRLQYVEFFSKFYTGGGKPYEPLKINTKYVNIVDRREI